MMSTKIILDQEDYEAAWTLLLLSRSHQKRHKQRIANKRRFEEAVKTVKKQSHKRKTVEEDDSEETLRRMIQWNKTKPEKPSFVREVDEVGFCSKPMTKQLMESDVKEDQCRLMLGKSQVKKMMVNVMGNSEGIASNGLEVSVYGPDGEIHKMMFKMWSGDTPVLTSTGWKKFVRDYGLNMHCDFLTIWMFMHRETRKICFAINFTRFPLYKQLSRRIIKAAFQDPN